MDEWEGQGQQWLQGGRASPRTMGLYTQSHLDTQGHKIKFILKQHWLDLIPGLLDSDKGDQDGQPHGKCPAGKLGCARGLGELHLQDLDMGSNHGCGMTQVPHGGSGSVGASPVHQGAVQPISHVLYSAPISCTVWERWES